MTNDTKQEVVVSKKPRTDIAEVQHPAPMVDVADGLELADVGRAGRVARKYPLAADGRD